LHALPGRFRLPKPKTALECGKGNDVYQKHEQHPELTRLIGAVAVSKQFRQALLRDPERILEHGYLGYQFDLTTEETTLVNKVVGGDIHEFSLRLWEWMSRNGHGNGSPPIDKLSQTTHSFEEMATSTTIPADPVSVRAEKFACPSFAPQPTSMLWNERANMESLILIVDDNHEMAQGLQLALETKGFQVALALDGDVAVRFLEDEQPDLILADIKMPRMDGYALLHMVKQNVEWCDIPFVLVTAAADAREAMMAKSMGADEYIVKPFDVEELIKVVIRLTNEKEIDTNAIDKGQETQL
jgi:CheY-like chemotaxis protein